MQAGLMLTDERISAMTSAGLWSNRTILDCLDEQLKSRPDQVYVSDNNSTTQRSTSWSFRNIDLISRRIAVGLAQHGVAAGDVVAAQLPNWWEMLAVHLACVRIGAITNPLMPIFRARELEFMLAFAETKVLIIPRVFRGFEYQPMITGLRAKLPLLEHVFVVDGAGENAFETTLVQRAWEDEIDAEALFSERRPKPNDVIQYCYTSGTSGQPKAVMHTSNTLLGCLGGALTLELGAETVVLMGSPLAHQTGFLFGGMLPILLGGRLVLMDIWNPEQAAKLIHNEGVTLTMGATPFLSDLTETAILDRYPPDTLDCFICAGAPIPRPLLQSANQRLGANIVAGWGMSENGLVTATRRSDSSQKVFETDGRPWHGMDVRIVDDQKNALGAGEDGHLQARGAANFVGYLKRPEAYSMDAHGWFDTGDIAKIDTDGYLTITGRGKDLIIRGGENVPIAEVESALYEHPSVHKVAIVAMPDARLGERGCAFVTLTDANAVFTLKDMVAHLAAADFTKSYWPERLEILEEMPMTPSGKIQKFRLREIAQSYRVED
jgi:cyclohexanecarboxylate-CoA ligase